jgi:hypothetical protein
MKADQVDMSPRAIARRLDEMRALYDLMRYLGKFRPLVEAAEQARKANKR